MAYEKRREEFRAYMRKVVNDNVALHNAEGSWGYLSYSLRCQVCNQQFCWDFDPAFIYGVDLEKVTDFCSEHLYCYDHASANHTKPFLVPKLPVKWQGFGGFEQKTELPLAQAV